MSIHPNSTTRGRKRLQKVVAMALAGAVLGTGGVVASQTILPSAVIDGAYAVSTGPGKWDGAGAGLGAFMHSNGTLVYCSELGQTVDQNNSPGMDRTGTLGAYNSQMYMIHGNTFNNVGVGAISGDRLQQINYILHQWGQTSDNTSAVAVQLAIWKIRAEVGATSGYNAALNYMINYAGSSANTRANEMVSQARQHAGETQQGSGQAPDGLEIADTGAYQGTVTVDAGTTSIRLTNAVFADTGLSTMEWTNGLNSKTTFSWIGQPPEGDFADKYTVAIRGTYEYQRGSTSWPSAVKEGDSGTGPYGSWQNMLSGIAPIDDFETVTGDFSAKYTDPSTIWAPTLTSEVPSERIEKGESFSDTVTFGVDPNHGPWRIGYPTSGGEIFAPITANGTLYGPFTYNPEDNPSETPPADAPIAATATVTTTTEQGPGTYTVDTGDVVSTEAGYYSWVWTIDGADQLESIIAPPNAESSLFEGSGYHFTDGFGTVNETHLTPLDAVFSTELDRNAAAPGNTIEDTIYPNITDAMFTIGPDGDIIPINLDGTLYWLPEPAPQSSDIPADAEVIGEYELELTSPDSPVVAGDIQLPHKEGWVTMVWEVDTDASPEVSYWRDDFGVPAESAQLLYPTVSTQATPNVPTFDVASDVALVEGEVPEGSELTFELFSRVAVGEPKFDEDGNVLRDDNGIIVTWTQEEYDALLEEQGLVLGDTTTNDAGEEVTVTQEMLDQAVCTASPIFNTRDNPIDVEGPGEYNSEGYRTTVGGTYYWVETLEYETPDGDTTYHVGECGIPNETTIVEDPEVTTMAVEEIMASETMTDTAIVTGPITQSEDIVTTVDFQVFRQDATHEIALNDFGIDTNAVCTPETLYDSTDSVTVTEAGEYESPAVQTDEGDHGIYYWIETLRWENTTTGETGIHQVGDCGVQNEKTNVTVYSEGSLSEGELPDTGSTPIWIAGLFALMLSVAGLGFVVMRRHSAQQ